MKASLILFYLGLSPVQDPASLEASWQALSHNQKQALVRQFSLDYNIMVTSDADLNRIQSPDERIVNLRAYDQMTE